MVEKVRDRKMDTPNARKALPARGKPYYRTIAKGLHLGYRKGQTGGRWVARHYVGEQDYVVETIADADDKLEANGTTVLTFSQAQDLARQLHAKRHAPTPTAGPYTVNDALDAYVHWMEGKRKSAQDTKWRRKLIEAELGDKEVAKLTADEIRKWHRKISETPPRLRTKKGKEQRYREIATDSVSIRQRRATANRVLTILKAALNYAWREGKVDSDHEWRRVEPFEDVETARVRYLSIPEAKRLVNACEPDFRNLVQAALQTGARYGELTRLTVADFNPDVGTLTISESKSGNSRHVVLTDEGKRLFTQLAAGKEGKALLLTNPSGNAWGISHQSRPMADACAKAKISPVIGFHGLRHTWASLAVMNGMPLLVVAAQLGHTDTRMVEKHYGHLSKSYIAEAVRAGAPRFGTVEETNIVPMEAAHV
ncbi:MAG: site-specific integrase [Mesorhizobium sp.]|uniref:tyrosine-type recombinase/integrase n=1 Tax=Mesorhizobium sp. TaxID=1871066 RepID=UPI0011FC37AF|nr:site-specific integrase [Mesorhizobium sp.]TIL70378.1 MAG: site-specific integrase [Mesorhizobium sp.]